MIHILVHHTYMDHYQAYLWGGADVRPRALPPRRWAAPPAPVVGVVLWGSHHGGGSLPPCPGLRPNVVIWGWTWPSP